MSFARLILREIRLRKTHFLLGVLSSAVAVACLTVSLTLLHLHDLATESLIGRKTAETAARLRDMEDDYRKITKRMGFNVLVLPAEQDLGDFYAENYASEFMPMEYVDRLAQSGLLTVRHLLPVLEQKVKWPEQERLVLLIGALGETPQQNAPAGRPLLQPVEKGHVVLGHELHTSLGIDRGDTIRFMDRTFKVHLLNAERGNKDDISLWIHLEEAQELLDRPGLINGILALECRCAWADAAKVRSEIQSILPKTRVVEFASKALARAEARERSAQEARDSIASLEAHRAEARREREELAAWLVPTVLTVCAAWIGVLAWTNARERRYEIGVLRAIGVRSSGLYVLFLGKAALAGLLGGPAGYVAGLLLPLTVPRSAALTVRAAEIVDPVHVAVIVLGTPLLAMLASWIPALLASQQDPARILSEER